VDASISMLRIYRFNELAMR